MKPLLYTTVVLAALVPNLSAGAAPQTVVVQWDSAAIQGVRDAKMGAPEAARALAITHTCMYDAWAPYVERAVGTQLSGALRRPANERTEANKERAISYAAYRALVDVLPGDTESVYKPLMRELGYDPNDRSTDIETPAGIGNVTCGAVLEFRHHDKSNQLGDMVPVDGAGIMAGLGAYSDWSGYRPVNQPSSVPTHFRLVKPLNPDHWQPVTYTDSGGNLVVQMFEGAQWCFVTPFALTKGDNLRPAVDTGPFKYGSAEYQEQADELVALSANLTDRQKMIAEYWSDAGDMPETLVHWLQFAQFISARDHHTLDDDVKMYFALTNAMLDAGIAAWDAKRTYDSVRPVTAIAVLFNGKQIRAWGGPGKGAVEMDGSTWIPYQPQTSPTPPTPEYVSDQSAFSEAAASVLERWTGNDQFGFSVTLPARSSRIEPGVTPQEPVELKWETFQDAAGEAGLSGRYGGIQFPRGDLAGRKLGGLAAERAWEKAQSYFSGANSPSNGSGVGSGSR